MTEVEYLDLEDLLGLVQRLRAGPVRDLGLLDAARARPRASLLGEDAYPSLPLKAAALLHFLARNHPLVDGNKRLAWLAAVVFLDINGLRSAATDDEAFERVVEVAAGLESLDVIAARMCVTADE
ncbi:MAG: type II toxin-antitoxin system death-on-curing family toxin [Actinomycetales bacterium]